MLFSAGPLDPFAFQNSSSFRLLFVCVCTLHSSLLCIAVATQLFSFQKEETFKMPTLLLLLLL